MKLRIVPASTGWMWVRKGLSTFAGQPIAMTGLFLLFIATVSLLSLVPVLGHLMALVLMPAASLGLMVAAQVSAQKRFPMPAVLLTAFRSGSGERTAMLKLGAMYAVGFVAMMGIVALADDGALAQVYLNGTPTSPQDGTPVGGFDAALWVIVPLYIPFSMAFWHAPALVHWHGVEPVKSVFFSLLACWQNKLALVVFSLCWIGVILLVGLGLALFDELLRSMTGRTSVPFLTPPIVLTTAAMFSTSLYFTYVDSFSDDNRPDGSIHPSTVTPGASE